MPAIKPNETREKFVARCVPFVIKNEGDDPSRATAKCHGIFDQHLKKRNEDIMNDNGKCEFELLFEDAEFDDEKKVIRNVVLLGEESKHGYKYSLSGMKEAVPLYDGTQVFINHPNDDEERAGRRDLMKLAGKVESPSFTEGENKVKGNVVLLNDQFGLKFFNIAKTMPEAAGCSQNAIGRFNEERTCVEEIKKVFSVDLVASPATTKSVFEGINNKSNVETNKMEYSDIDLTELRLRRTDIIETLVNEGKSSRDEEVKILTEERDKIKKENDDFKAIEETDKVRQSIDKMLKEAELDGSLTTDIFIESLVNAKDDETRKNLIEDRKGMKKEKTGVYNSGESNDGNIKGGEVVTKEVALSALRETARL